jgi:hypothetical protein
MACSGRHQYQCLSPTSTTLTPHNCLFLLPQFKGRVSTRRRQYARRRTIRHGTTAIHIAARNKGIARNVIVTGLGRQNGGRELLLWLLLLLLFSRRSKSVFANLVIGHYRFDDGGRRRRRLVGFDFRGNRWSSGSSDSDNILLDDGLGRQ